MKMNNDISDNAEQQGKRIQANEREKQTPKEKQIIHAANGVEKEKI